MSDRETVVKYIREKKPEYDDETVRRILEEIKSSVFDGMTVCQFVRECDDGWDEVLSTFKRIYG